MDLVKPFLGKLVVIQTKEYCFTGRFIHFKLNRYRNHEPNIFFLENENGLFLIRGNWFVIKSLMGISDFA
ncbi:MAG: hypothetical protein AC479_05985 [miscellaneous Crenarchaeota group-6 archaeon AD8-1]|nr:MAG: hypothetical protein AC479_05985 [miscellaneous Crenarchaeota group-6 archaeon AD8-1]